MFDLETYLKRLTEQCLANFGERLAYIGLQGSYMRGEAGSDSDIDIMAVIEKLTVEDMNSYRKILKGLGYFEKSCGFICGREELARWNPLEICQLRFTTKDIYGKLSGLLPPASREDEINYIKMSLGNIYHGICHRYIHGVCQSDRADIRGTCKEIFFVIQNLHYLEKGEFVITTSELKGKVSERDRAILGLPETCTDPAAGTVKLFEWCQDAIIRSESLK